jgi:hypothetical protein
MARNEDEINKQKFDGIMDSGTDLTLVKQGRHRASYGFRAITANDDTFKFETIQGTQNTLSIRQGYRICNWEVYENTIYVLSKRWIVPTSFSYADAVGGKIRLYFGDNIDTDVYQQGDYIFVEFDHDNPYNHIIQSGSFEILSIVDSTTLEIDLDASLFYTEFLGVGSGGGLIEKLGGGEIGEIRVDLSSGAGEYKTLYWHEKLRFSFRRYGSRESTHINKENAKILRWYFTDYLNEPKVFNLNSDIYRTVIGGLEVEDQETYMVTDGTITYDGVDYGPELDNGNIFTTTATQGLVYAGTGRVIEYYPVELLDWSPDFNQGDVQFLRSEGGGNVKTGTYSAVYRCIDNEGAVTPWSLPTNPIYLAKGGTGVSIAGYHEQQGTISGENSGKKLVFGLFNLDTRWTKVQVAIIEHTSELTFNNPLVFFEEEFGSESIEVEYTGTEGKYSFDLGEISAFNRVFKKVLTIESMQEINFASNFESDSILSEYNPENVELGYTVQELLSDEVESNDFVSDDGNHIWNADGGAPYSINQGYPFPLTGHTPSSPDGYLAGQYYTVEGGNITIGQPGNDTEFVENEIFTVDDSQTQLTQSGTGSFVVTPVIRIKHHQDIPGIDTTDNMVVGQVYEVVGGDLGPYLQGRTFKWDGSALTFNPGVTVTLTGYQVYKNESYLDGNGDLVQNKLMTYPRNEKIRVGIVPVNKKGTKLPPRWIGDYTMPDIQTEKLSNGVKKLSRSDKYCAFLRHLGLKVGTQANPLDLSDIIDELSGFHIVIAPIKRRTKVQGLMFQTQRQSTEPVIIAPEFWTYLGIDGYYQELTFPTAYTHGFPVCKVLMGPDVMMRTEEDLAIGSDDILKIEAYLNDEQWEILEGQTSWVALKGNWFYADQQIPRPLAEYGFFFKYQDLGPDQTTDRTDPGSSVSIVDVKKYRFETAGEIPSEPDWQWRAASVSDNTLLFPGDAAGNFRYSSYIFNHLLIVHEEEETFGPEVDDIRNGVLASITAPGEVSYESTENSQYVSTGHFQPLTDLIKEQTQGIFYDIEVFGGQTFLSFFSQLRNTPFSRSGNIFDGDEDYPPIGLSITFPCESRVNPYRRTGVHVARDREELFIDDVPENFVINEGSKYIGDLVKYAALQQLDFENTLFERSTAYSLAKINGEQFDKWRQFPFANIKTAEGDMERIVASKQSDNYLILWHEKGVSYYPINDRAAIPDNQGGNIRLGYGGIMDVNIPLSFNHGLQDRLALVATEKFFIWVSKRTKQIIVMAKGGKPEPINDKNILDASLKTILPDDSQIFNIDDPYFTYGIVGAYDSHHREVLFSFMNSNEAGRSRLHIDRNIFRTLVIDSERIVPVGYFPFVADRFMVLDRFVYSQAPLPRQAIVGESLAADEIVFHQNRIWVVGEATTVPDPLDLLILDPNFTEVAQSRNVFLHYHGDNMEFYGVQVIPEFHAIFNQPLELFKRFDAHHLRTNRAPDTVECITDVTSSLEEQSTFDPRDYSQAASLPLTRENSRLRGHGILIIYKWSKSMTATVLRQIDLFFKFISQK